jgi:hypothetical protein
MKERLISEMRHQRQSMNSTWGSIGGNNSVQQMVKECSREVSELIKELQNVMLGEFESNDYHISSRQILRDLI